MKNSQFSKIKGPKRKILEMTKKSIIFQYFLRIGSFPTFKIGSMKNLVILLREIYKLTFKDFRSVKAVENCVKHYFRIIAIRIELGTETISVWNDACILSDDRIGSWIFNFYSALSCPCPFLEIIFIAKGLIVVKTII